MSENLDRLTSTADSGTNDASRLMLSRRSVFGLGAAALAGLGVVACGSSGDTASISPSPAAPGDPKSVAIEAYTFGYPLVLMDVTKASAAPVNTFEHGVPPNPADKSIVRLNFDTLYSQAWLDLRAEPMVLQVPVMPGGRYWLMQLLDAWTNTCHDPSSVKPQTTTADRVPHTYVLTGPGWSGTLPENATQLAMPTPTVWVIGRIQFNGEADLPAVQGLQQQLKLVPLSRWAAGSRDGTVSRTYVTDPTLVPPTKQLADMEGRVFFDKLCALMAIDPPAAADGPAMKRFETIGITPGGTTGKLQDAVLTAATAEARNQISSYQNPATKDENGWMFATNVGTYGTDYNQRAYIALTGLGANLPQDALYPTLFGTADDSGAPRKFRIRFPSGQLPPVDAFWSITAYGPDGAFIANPARIYAVGHQVPVVAGPDGTVEIVVQNANPGPAVPTGNWLPIPVSGKFSLTMRLYAPKQQALEGNWPIPALTPVN